MDPTSWMLVPWRVGMSSYAELVGIGTDFMLRFNVRAPHERVSELRRVRTGKANPGLAQWAEQVPSAALFVSVITIHELEHGVLLMERADPDRGAVLRQWLNESVAAAFKSRVLPVDERVSRLAAAVHVPDPAPFRDALIGATAIAHDMTVVSRNVKDLERFDELAVLDPWG